MSVGDAWQADNRSVDVRYHDRRVGKGWVVRCHDDAHGDSGQMLCDGMSEGH